MSDSTQKMRPVVEGRWQLIGPTPDLTHVLPSINEDQPYMPEPNDHTIFRSADGKWQLWACVRNTPVGRCLVNWESELLPEAPWRWTEQIIRCDREAGESRTDWYGQEFLQSPFVVESDGQYYMYYGGYDSDLQQSVEYKDLDKQICLMISADGKNWTRHRDDNGFSRVFTGPGATRDESLVQFNGIWHMYYTGHLNGDLEQEAILCRTSDNLINWSDWAIVHYADEAHRSHHGCESPVVVERNGYFYLFRSGGYEGDGNGSTSVFRSSNPLDFGRDGNPDAFYVCNLPAHAPEIIVNEDGNEYISRIFDTEEDRYAGIQLARLRWVPET